MSKLTLPLSLVVLGMVIGLSLQLWYWPQLPERMAIHFDANGTPNDWMGKVPATLLSISLVTLLPMFFLSISQVIRWMPTSMINLPHREYWLAPERREESFRWMTGWMIWFTLFVLIFIIAINHLTFIANRDSQPLSAVGFWGMLGTFLFSTFAFVVIMIRRFAKPTL
jgi:uncharacterized membrane protein